MLDLETYLVECECCVDVNGDISPAGPYEEDRSEAADSWTTEMLSYFAQLKKLATHLADISSVTLRQQKNGIFSDDDLAFANLVSDCGDELTGLGEYLIDVAKSIQSNQTSHVMDLSSLSEEAVVLTQKDVGDKSRSSGASGKELQDTQSNSHHSDSEKQIRYHFKCELCGNDYEHKDKFLITWIGMLPTHTIVNSATKCTTLNMHLLNMCSHI